MGHRGRGNRRGWVLPFSEVGDGQGSVAGGSRGRLTVTAFFPRYRDTNEMKMQMKVTKTLQKTFRILLSRRFIRGAFL